MDIFNNFRFVCYIYYKMTKHSHCCYNYTLLRFKINTTFARSRAENLLLQYVCALISFALQMLQIELKLIIHLMPCV